MLVQGTESILLFIVIITNGGIKSYTYLLQHLSVAVQSKGKYSLH